MQRCGQVLGKATLILPLVGADSSGALTTLSQKRQVDGTWKRVAPAVGKGYCRTYGYKDTIKPYGLVGNEPKEKKILNRPSLHSSPAL